MDQFPVTPRKRHAFEVLIRIVDLVVYLGVFFAGTYAIVATPHAALQTLSGSRWLILLWAGLLLGGGLVGFIGRLSRRWLLETPATIAAFFGCLIYFVILSRYMFLNAATVVGLMLVAIATVAMLRRWLELQIFGSEPNARMTARLKSALDRRTANTVNRSL